MFTKKRNLQKVFVMYSIIQLMLIKQLLVLIYKIREKSVWGDYLSLEWQQTTVYLF